MNKITTSEFVNWLDQFINYTRNIHKSELNLNKMNYFADFFQNPQNNYASIHIAGSKGKGSTSSMVSAILSNLNFSVGVYLSPHVYDFRERISLNNTFFTDEVYSSVYEKIIKGFNSILKRRPDIDPGWFEIVTMTAFLLFSMQKLDWAVFETGMGGRFDMTNILNPKLCILTPIELEHCKYLGDTVEKIAYEKAGIIKRNTPVFCCKQSNNVLAVFKQYAKEKSAPFFYLPDLVKNINSQVSKTELNVKIDFNGNLNFKRPLHTSLKLIDEVQAENAALAAASVKYLFPDIDEQTIEFGLSKVTIPARFEILSQNPFIVIDGAHTKNSISLCLNTYFKLISKKGILIFACAEDKNTADIAPLFKNKFTKIFITIPGTSKKSSIESTFNDFYKSVRSSHTDIQKSANYEKCISDAIQLSIINDTPLLIIGSFYLAAEAKKIYTRQVCVNETHQV